MHSEILRAVMQCNMADVERAARFAEHRVDFVRRPGRPVSAMLRRIDYAVGGCLRANWRRWMSPDPIDPTEADLMVGPCVIRVGPDRRPD